MSWFLWGIRCQNGENCHGFCDAKTIRKQKLASNGLSFSHTLCEILGRVFNFILVSTYDIHGSVYDHRIHILLGANVMFGPHPTGRDGVSACRWWNRIFQVLWTNCQRYCNLHLDVSQHLCNLVALCHCYIRCTDALIPNTMPSELVLNFSMQLYPLMNNKFEQTSVRLFCEICIFAI